MSRQWAVRLNVDDAASLGPLRCRPGLEVCRQDNYCWLRGGDWGESIDRALRALPGRRFTVLPDRQLVEFGALVPKGHLPDGPWTPLSRWMAVQAPTPALAAGPARRVRLSLVRGGPVREANVLVTRIGPFTDWASWAAQVRLERLSFAAGDDGRTVVHGTPLPPITGRPFVEEQGVAVPAGWTWRPGVAAAVLRPLFGLEENDLALLGEDGTWERIPAAGFVRAARSAVRLTDQGTAR